MAPVTRVWSWLGVRRAAVPALPRRRTAPRALAWGAAAFALLHLGVGLAAELYPRVRDPLYGDKLVKLQRRLPAEGRPPTVVMIGSSRTGLAFHGKRVEAQSPRPVVAFNYGVPASGPVTHLVYLNRLLKDGVVPDLLFVEVMPSMLADLPDAPLEQLWFYADRLTYSEQETVIRHGFPADKVRERWWKSTLLPAYTIRFQLLTRVAPSWLPWQVRFDWSRGADECGWGSMMYQQISDAERTKAIAQARAEYSAVLADLKPGGPAVAALRELIALCKDRAIPLRLVLMPEGSEFRDLYPPHVVARLTAFVATLDAEVIDARLWLRDDQFRDSHHMFTAGAEAFSDRLTRDVIAPHLR